MLFNSLAFLVFLPVVLAGFFLAGGLRARAGAAWLALASLFFYGWWNPQFTGLLLLSILFNYGAGVAIMRTRQIDTDAARARAKLILAGAITVDLALLGFFKYANFFLGAARDVAGVSWSLPEIVLPIGISFYTFTQIAFLVDAHRGAARSYDFVHYLLFVTYFPHLIAGPILHHGRMVPQFEDRSIYRPHADNLARGSAIFAVGLFKKVWVADHFAGLSDTFFTAAAAGHPFHFVDAWGGALAYSLQLYFDFSAYCDMAIGISLMFNVRLPLNFNSPYKATSIIDFWRRWHITLSEFLRDYLYVPLGGNRRGAARRYLNLGITMVLGGLWHGANWTFVVWGALHGAYLVANHAWRALLQRLGIRLGPAWKWPAMAVTFTLVVFAWVPFRAETMGRAMDVWRLMFGAGTVPSALLGDPRQWLSLVVGVAIVWFLPNLQQWAGYADPAGSEPPASPIARAAWSPSLRWGLLCGLMAALALSNLGKESPFLYFQF